MLYYNKDNLPNIVKISIATIGDERTNQSDNYEKWIIRQRNRGKVQKINKDDYISLGNYKNKETEQQIRGRRRWIFSDFSNQYENWSLYTEPADLGASDIRWIRRYILWLLSVRSVSLFLNVQTILYGSFPFLKYLL